MPQKFYDAEQLEGKRVPCDAYREDLKFCIQNTDCYKKVGQLLHFREYRVVCYPV